MVGTSQYKISGAENISMNEDKATQLLELKKELEANGNLPLVSATNSIVFGDGNPKAEVLFIGEAPGYWESIEKRPFVGQAGKLLNRTLELIGLKREDVYITNIVKARPPENRDPEPNEIEAFRYYLDKEVEIIKPKIIVTLGRFSMGKFFPGEMISRIHGKPLEMTWHGMFVTIVPMYHPAAALRAGRVLQQFEEDFLRLPEILEKAKYEPAVKKDDPEQMNLL